MPNDMFNQLNPSAPLYPALDIIDRQIKIGDIVANANEKGLGIFLVKDVRRRKDYKWLPIAPNYRSEVQAEYLVCEPVRNFKGKELRYATIWNKKTVLLYNTRENMIVIGNILDEDFQ